jgi:hypothetical protein
MQFYKHQTNNQNLMKKMLFSALIVIMITGSMSGQSTRPYPIPSYGIQVDGFALFCESGNPGNPDPSKAKKDGIIKIYPSNPEVTTCSATVWWYSLDGLDVLGPFTVLCGETLVTAIDERAWGVLVQSNDDIVVDVWIE